MNPTAIIGRLLGLDATQTIERIDASLIAPWARQSPAWLLFGLLGLAVWSMVFYLKCQTGKRTGIRRMLGVLRAGLLGLLLVMLAEPVLSVHVANQLRPSLWLLIDGSDSMAVADRLPQDEYERVARAVGLVEKEVGGLGADQATPRSKRQPRTARIEFVKALLGKETDNLLARLEKTFRLKAFLFDSADGVRMLKLSADGSATVDPQYLVSQLTTNGQVTALGAAFDDLARRYPAADLAGLVVISDFNQNAGPSAVTAAERFAASVFCVGVGPTAAADLHVDLQVPPVMKKGEQATLVATLGQEGFGGRAVEVVFSARLSDEPGGSGTFDVIGSRKVTLDGPVHSVEMPYTPSVSGRLVVKAEVEPLEEEVIVRNNRVTREGTVRDDFLRLLFVEYEPSWEWRFVKEVFHRDPLVGMQGFRTFLRSADPKVRMENPLFLPALTVSRSEFFAHDVIILGDMPARALSATFCRMTEEFVGKFGGGLVVLAGPRFGVGQLADTPLRDLLPVKVDADSGVRKADTAETPFPLNRTAEAGLVDFMQLGNSPDENDKAWDNLGPLSWYQPVQRLRPLATALAEHPSDTCVDGQTKQPLIAIQNYGRGEVVYLGFDEMWRLRRRYGERYYRRFWGQLIHRLASRHALGDGKRFVVRTDRARYRPNQRVRITVEAYDGQFEPLTEDDLPERALAAELLLPPSAAREGPDVRPISIPLLRDGVFETEVPVYAQGEYRLRVHDPIRDPTHDPIHDPVHDSTYDPTGGSEVEIGFRVAATSVERQRPVRNAALQRAIADATGGKSYDLASVDRITDDVDSGRRTETTVQIIELFGGWPAFACLIGLMLGEWLVRQWVHLP